MEMEDSPQGLVANQQDLPWQLRNQYQALQVLGRGAFAVVIRSQLKSNHNNTHAIKLIFPVGRYFDADTKKQLDREVLDFTQKGLAYFISN